MRYLIYSIAFGLAVLFFSFMMGLNDGYKAMNRMDALDDYCIHSKHPIGRLCNE